MSDSIEIKPKKKDRDIFQEAFLNRITERKKHSIRNIWEIWESEKLQAGPFVAIDFGSESTMAAIEPDYEIKELGFLGLPVVDIPDIPFRRVNVGEFAYDIKKKDKKAKYDKEPEKTASINVKALLNENKELKEMLASLNPPRKLMRHSITLMVFTAFSYTVSNLLNINLLHPYLSLGLFGIGFVFFIMSNLMPKEQK